MRDVSSHDRAARTSSAAPAPAEPKAALLPQLPDSRRHLQDRDELDLSASASQNQLQLRPWHCCAPASRHLAFHLNPKSVLGFQGVRGHVCPLSPDRCSHADGHRLLPLPAKRCITGRADPNRCHIDTILPVHLDFPLCLLYDLSDRPPLWRVAADHT